MPEAFIKRRVFWLLWLTGLALFFFIVATNLYLITPTAPAGIIDHQSAATAARVNAIHASWKDAGVNGFATTSMLIDLLFITLYALGGLVGALQIRRSTQSRGLRLFTTLIVLLYGTFAALDYAETFSELVQQLTGQGNDALALIAATARPLKMSAFLLGSLCTVVSLIWHHLSSPNRRRTT